MRNRIADATHDTITVNTRIFFNVKWIFLVSYSLPTARNAWSGRPLWKLYILRKAGWRWAESRGQFGVHVDAVTSSQGKRKMTYFHPAKLVRTIKKKSSSSKTSLENRSREECFPHTILHSSFPHQPQIWAQFELIRRLHFFFLSHSNLHCWHFALSRVHTLVICKPTAFSVLVFVSFFLSTF